MKGLSIKVRLSSLGGDHDLTNRQEVSLDRVMLSQVSQRKLLGAQSRAFQDSSETKRPHTVKGLILPEA